MKADDFEKRVGDKPLRPTVDPGSITALLVGVACLVGTSLRETPSAPTQRLAVSFGMSLLAGGAASVWFWATRRSIQVNFRKAGTARSIGWAAAGLSVFAVSAGLDTPAIALFIAWIAARLVAKRQMSHALAFLRRGGDLGSIRNTGEW